MADHTPSSPWTSTPPPEALALSRGCYQTAILRGQQRLSGADLRGKASKYGLHYKRSREAILSRLDAASVKYRIVGGTARTGPMRLEYQMRLIDAVREWRP